jgi:drug/metabolite transporter (DMT)-like permease
LRKNETGKETPQLQSQKKAYVYLVLALGSWGSLYVAGKYVLEVLPSFVLLFLRYLIGVSALLIFYRKHPKARIEKKDRKYVFAIGFLGYFLAIGFQLLGTHYCNASMASLINSVNPAMIVILAFFILHEGITLRKGLAVGVTLLGTAAVIGDPGTGNTAAGVLFSFASMAAWSLTSVLVRLCCQKYDSVTVTLYGMSVGMIFALPTAILEARLSAAFNIADVTLPVAMWTVYIGIVCTAGGLLLWNKALELTDAATCSLFYPLQPLTSAVLGVLFLKEVLNLNFIVGSVLIVGGIIFAVLGDISAKP